MNEIEVKAKLRDREKVLEYIKNSRAEFLGEKHQRDIVFWPNHIRKIEEGINLLGINYLRIRKQESEKNKKVIFTLKQPVKCESDCKEYEIEIKEEDITNLESIILTLGFYEFCITEKDRETYKLGEIEICLDNVVGLGSYIELEKFGTADETEKIQNELSDILELWGVAREDHTEHGYDILAYNLKNNL
ncbi:MAG: class IV adenylate cyclase [Candidatus Paceibacterota bacterium]